MIFQGYDWNLRAPLPQEVPDEPIHTFIRSILESTQWRDRPEEVVDRLVKLRKTLLAAAQPVPSALPEEDEGDEIVGDSESEDDGE
jgi:hypothetical protein